MMLSLEEAKTILNIVAQKPPLIPLNTEQVPLWEAAGRVLSKEIISGRDVPAFNRSPVDGYALIAADTTGATADHPALLEVAGSVAAGSFSAIILTSGKTMKIFTGAPVPFGADCVIKKEQAGVSIAKVGNKTAITIKKEITKGEGIAFKGEDIAAGEHMFTAGTILGPAHLGVLAALGIDPVPVYAQPQIGIFSTGDELVDVHSRLQPGKLRVSNIYTLAGIVRQAGGIPISLGVAKDRVENILKIYAKTCRLKLPVVISTGGTASGDYDVIKKAMDAVSSKRLFNKVAIRPGAPVVVSVSKTGQLLIGLSGNPAGAAVAMLMLIYPLIAKLAGTSRQLECVQGKLVKPLLRQGGLRGFLWANYTHRKDCLHVTPLKNQFCGAIKTYAKCNCLVEIPAGAIDAKPLDPVTVWKLP